MPRHKLAIAFVMDPDRVHRHRGRHDFCADAGGAAARPPRLLRRAGRSRRRGGQRHRAGPARRDAAPRGRAPRRARAAARQRRSTTISTSSSSAPIPRSTPPTSRPPRSSRSAAGRCVLNRPQGILAANEKLYALHFPELMAETLVTHRIPQLVDFLAKCGGEMIVKPLDGRGGEGIFHVRHDDRNLFSILEQATRFGKRRDDGAALPAGGPARRQAHPAARR